VGEAQRLPDPAVADPMAAPPLRWGVLGPGGIANKLADAVQRLTAGSVVAVASRDQGRAEAFAGRHGIPRAYAGYERLAADPEVQAVYIGTPHSEHAANALAMVRAGKHVLVEKPLVRNGAEADKLFARARETGVTVIEAMWTRFLPHLAVVREVIASGRIGEVVTVLADHGQRFPFQPEHRLYAPELAGGALLDLGVYPVALAVGILGAPESVCAAGQLAETGVDGAAGLVLGYPPAASGSPRQAVLHTTLWARTPTTASITGTAGRIELSGPFYQPGQVRVATEDGVELTWDGLVDNGFQYEAAELARCVAAGLQESLLLPWSDSRACLAVLDEARRQLGVRYPGE